MIEVTFTGSHGKAWEVPQKGPGWEACLQFYYVRLDNYHPMLKWFVVIVNHLRHEVGDKGAPPSKQSADCTHEIVVASVDPEVYLFDEIDPETFKGLKLLEPLEVWHQLQGLNDTLARTLGQLVVTELTNGLRDPNHEDKAAWTNFLQDKQRNLRVWMPAAK